MRLHVVDTVLLHNDITENVTMGSSELTVIQHKFMEYGIYQDCGTGRDMRSTASCIMTVIEGITRAI